MEGSYQFIHIDSYAREGSERKTTVTKKNGDKVTTITKIRDAREILAEQWREQGACPHIKEPGKPGLLYGVPPMEVLPMIEEWAEQTTDARGHKLRKDGLCVLIGVASLPREMEDSFPEFAESTLAWLKQKYGDRLKSVVVHDDEAHPHLHFSVVPRIGERFDDVHEGYRASKLAKTEGKKKGEQNLAYIEAMRGLQDEFSKRVAMRHGLTRIGPGRRRLTRAQWKAEKAQAAYFADAKKVAQVHANKGYNKGKAQAEEKAKAIIENSQKKANSIGNKAASLVAGVIGGWHEPTARAKAETEKANALAENERKKRLEAEKKAKEEADRRVAAVGNQITIEKSKNAELEKEVEKQGDKIRILGCCTCLV
ncbi:MAG: plasmid recombination protein [Roseateles sp.]|uniref:plasmid recombination protein n=1 Tax=Roseateles sp. TaxID=1971397 RepID=UPI0039EC115F